MKKEDNLENLLSEANIECHKIGKVMESDVLGIINGHEAYTMTVSKLRDTWYKTSYLLDKKWDLSFYRNATKSLFTSTTISFLSKRKIFIN